MKLFDYFKSFFNKKEKKAKQDFLQKIEDENWIKVAKGAGGALYEIPGDEKNYCVVFRGKAKDISRENIQYSDYCRLRFFRRYEINQDEKINLETFQEHHSFEVKNQINIK